MAYVDSFPVCCCIFRDQQPNLWNSASGMLVHGSVAAFLQRAAWKIPMAWKIFLPVLPCSSDIDWIVMQTDLSLISPEHTWLQQVTLQ